MKRICIVIIFFLLSGLWYISRVGADNMSSSSYYLQFGTLNMTSGTKTSGSYKATDTVGQTGPGLYTGGSQNVKSGFQYIYPFASPTASPSATPIPTLAPSPLASAAAALLQNITDILTQAGLITPLIQTQLAQVIEETAPVVAATIPIVVTAAVVAQTVSSFLPIIFEILSRLLQSIGLIPAKRPRGVVFDTKTGKPVPFARVSFVRISDNQIVDTVVSDVHGVYRSVKLPPAVYRIEAIHGDYIFPSKLTPKFALNPHDFYRGEPFEITSSNQEELFLIPMDPIFEEAGERQSFSFYAQLTLQIMRRLVFALFYPMIVFSVVVTIIFPTPLNIAIVIMYAIMIVYRVRHTQRQPPLVGQVVDRYGRPMPDVMVRCVETQTNHVGALVVTNAQGTFKINLPPLAYTLVVNKDGYVVEQPSQDYSNVYISHTGTEGTILIHLMTVKEAFPESAT